MFLGQLISAFSLSKSGCFVYC